MCAVLIEICYSCSDSGARIAHHQSSYVSVTAGGTSSSTSDRRAVFMGGKYPEAAKNSAFQIPGKLLSFQGHKDYKRYGFKVMSLQ